MHKNKAIQILKSFTPEEIKKFEKFINSPYFNTSKDVIKLFSFIKKFYPEFHDKKFNLETIAKNFNSKTKGTTEGRIRNIFTDLNNLTRKFFSIEYFTKYEFYMKYAEINKLQEKNLMDLSNKAMDYYFSKFGEVNSIFEDYTYETKNIYNFRVHNFIQNGTPYKGKEAFEKCSEFGSLLALEIMLGNKRISFANQLKYNFKYTSLSAVMYDLFDFEKFIEYTKEHVPKIYKIVSLEYYSMKMFLNRDFEDSNEKVKELFYGHFNNDKVNVLYRGFFCVQWLNSYIVKIDYYSSPEEIPQLALEALTIADFSLMKKFYLPMFQSLTIPGFIGYLYFAFKAKNSKWMLHLIKDFQNALRPHERDSTINFAYGLYNSRIANYSEALTYFSKANTSNQAVNEAVKYEVMICHFKLKNYETSLAFSDAVLRGLERKVKETNISRWETEFIKLFRQLLKIVSNSTKSGLEEFEIKLNKAGGRIQFEFINRMLYPSEKCQPILINKNREIVKE